MAVSGADVEKIKDEMDPKLNELALAIERLKKEAGEKEKREKYKKRKAVLLQAIQNINHETKARRVTNGWDFWSAAHTYGNDYFSTNSYYIPHIPSNMYIDSETIHDIEGDSFFMSEDLTTYVYLGKTERGSNVKKVWYTKNDSVEQTSNAQATFITDFTGNPSKLYADPEISFFTFCVDNNKVRIYEKQDTGFTFTTQIDFSGETISSMEGGGDMIFITTRSNRVYGIKRNAKGSFAKLTHSQLGIDISGSLIYSKCTPDGETVVFVNASGYTKGGEFVKIFKRINGVYQKQSLDVRNRRRTDNPNFTNASKRRRKNLQISANGETIIVIDYKYDRCACLTIIKKAQNGYRVQFTSLEVYRSLLTPLNEYINFESAKKVNYTLSDCGQFLFIGELGVQASGSGLNLYYLDLTNEKLLNRSPRFFGFVPLTSNIGSNFYAYIQNFLDLGIINGNILYTLHTTDNTNGYKITNRYFIQIPWED